MWLIQDSETANYISANTKDCPKCKVCIEKNGGKTISKINLSEIYI